MKKKSVPSTCPTCGQSIDLGDAPLLAIRGRVQEIIKAIDTRVIDGKWIPRLFVQEKKHTEVGNA